MVLDITEKTVRFISKYFVCLKHDNISQYLNNTYNDKKDVCLLKDGYVYIHGFYSKFLIIRWIQQIKEYFNPLKIIVEYGRK